MEFQSTVQFVPPGSPVSANVTGYDGFGVPILLRLFELKFITKTAWTLGSYVSPYGLTPTATVATTVVPLITVVQSLVQLGT